MDDTFPAFEAFYHQVHDRRPFPWQSRLAAQVAERGWPDEIGIPTGLGKTACLDIAVWALAAQAGRPAAERTAPTRIWYVVNRRLLVDAAYDHGLYLAHILGEAATGPVAGVAQALRTLADSGAGETPLHVVRLRGGAEHGVRPPTPAQPTLAFATVPMFASRWLFRGYGVSARMRSVDAALAGIDCLVLLDEAHLARPLAALLEPVRDCDPGDSGRLLPAERSRPRLVAMTATGGEADRFELDEEDVAHEVVQRRVGARKPVRLATATKRTLSRVLGDTALDLVASQEQARACVVFVNTTSTVAEVSQRLRQKSEDIDLVVLTGRLRSREAATVRARLLDSDNGVASGHAVTRERPLIVVATQTLEVGADLDFDLLVSETAGVRAIVQRMGRLDRLGQRPHARGVLVHPTDQPDRPVYGTEPEAVWSRLSDVASDDVVELGPGRAGHILGAPADAPPRAGELLPAHLWELAKTWPAPPDAAHPELFFAGMEEERARISVCWRAWLPEADARAAAIPTQDESVDVPIGEARTLATRAGTEATRRLTSDGHLEPVEARSLKPGDVVVIRSGIGGYDPTLGFDPEASSTVLDLSVVNRHIVPLKPEVIRHLVASLPEGEPAGALAALTPPSDPDATVDVADREAARTAVIDLLTACEPAPGITEAEWNGLLQQLQASRLDILGEGTVVAVPARSRPAPAQIASDVFDDLSFDASSTALRSHCGTVGELAGRLAHAIGLPADIATALATAGRWHDLGKADVRFQRWLAPHGQDGLLAKSGRAYYSQRDRQAAGWPRGGRHELLSGRLLEADQSNGHAASHRELVHHLVISHHGYGRPSVPAVDDPFPVVVDLATNNGTVTCSGDLSREDWAQPARFRRLCETYGYWGLALLEAVLRQADHAASSRIEVL